MDHFIKEACAETFEEALLAEKNGAHRIELCSRFDLDGLTPDLDLIKKVIDKLSIPVKVMIRPRAGNFVYSEAELEEMKDSILLCKKLKTHSVVFGVLDEENCLNLNQIKTLTEFAAPLEVTIHKAIDLCPDLISSIEALKTIDGITSILTSGGANSAIEGKEILKKIINVAGSSMIIISAGKITKTNLESVHELIGGTEYHGRRIVGEQG